MKDNQQPQNTQLTKSEEAFCQTYVYGGHKLAGQPSKCYKEVYAIKDGSCRKQAIALLKSAHISARIKELMAEEDKELKAAAMLLRATETLQSIMQETSTAVYHDRFGNPISPAPLRAVSVNAAKALVDMYDKKESTLKIEGDNGGVVFNVIAPIPPQPQKD